VIRRGGGTTTAAVTTPGDGTMTGGTTEKRRGTNKPNNLPRPDRGGQWFDGTVSTGEACIVATPDPTLDGLYTCCAQPLQGEAAPPDTE